MEAYHPKFNKEQKNQAEELGGSDYDEWQDYSEPTNQPYYNKPNHFERSTYHSPQHEAHRDDIYREP